VRFSYVERCCLDIWTGCDARASLPVCHATPWASLLN
jgi:hypothetical protein